MSAYDIEPGYDDVSECDILPGYGDVGECDILPDYGDVGEYVSCLVRATLDILCVRLIGCRSIS